MTFAHLLCAFRLHFIYTYQPFQLMQLGNTSTGVARSPTASDEPMSHFLRLITALAHPIYLYLANGRKIQPSAITRCIQAEDDFAKTSKIDYCKRREYCSKPIRLFRPNWRVQFLPIHESYPLIS